MEGPPLIGAVCSVCGATLSGGDCLACLLGAGLEETAQGEASLPPIFGDFEIARRDDGSLWELGRGAMGVTYRAVDHVLHRGVALKVVEIPKTAPGGGQAVRDRFLREARAAAALRHANIASVFQFGAAPEAGRCYYAMELVEGETLAARVRRDGPLSVDEALEMASQVGAALTEAAARGVIHRDLKPSNLMLAGGGATGSKLQVKVIDFGLAKAAAASAHETDLTQGGFVGTPAFASPEQFEPGAEIDARADIYSLGVTLWYALTGRAPFTGRTMDNRPYLQAREILPVEQLAARKIPRPVIALLRSVLAVDPAGRPATARELTATVENCRRQLCPGRRSPEILSRVLMILLALAAAALTWSVLARVNPHRRHPPVALPADKSIAVLPFANLSADPENAFFTDGVQEEILTDLAKVGDLKVISRTSVMPYKSGARRNLREIAQALGVAHILEGSVQRAGGKIRVSAQLIDARTDTHLWGDRYDRNLADVFAIQSEIAQAIAGQLQAKLSPREKAAIDMPPTTDLAAYDAYLRGQKSGRDAELTKDEAEIRQAVRQLEAATSQDPGFYLAWYELARAHLSLYWWNIDHTADRLARAEAAVQTARRLRPEAGESALVEGMRLYWGHRDFAGAIAQFENAARLLPNNSEVPYWLCLVLRRQGRWEESVRQIGRAAELDPRNAEVWIIMAETDKDLYRYAEAERANDRALALDPHNLELAYWQAYCRRLERAELDPMRRWLRSLPAGSEQWSDTAALESACVALDDGHYAEAAQALAGYHAQTIIDQGYIWPRAQLVGRILALNGDKPGARAAFLVAQERAADTLKSHPRDAKALMVMANIEAYLGQKAEAIRTGEQACALLPISADAIDGPFLVQQLAEVYAQSGALDQAIAALRSIVGQPAGPSYGELRLEHGWDPLRGDPRFAALADSRAPPPSR